MGNNLQVTVTANIGDLQSQMLLAQAQVKALTAECNKLSLATAKGLVGPTQLPELSAQLVTAKQNLASVKAEFDEAAKGFKNMGGAAESSHGSIATATREFRALFDELSSGRTRQTPGTLAIIATRVLGLSGAALAGIGAVAALTAGLGYLAYRSIEAANALNSIKLGADFAGNLNLSRGALQQFIDELAKAKGVSTSDAQEIVGALARVPGMTGTSLAAATKLVASYAEDTNQEATKAAEGLAKMLMPSETATAAVEKLAAESYNVTPAMLQSAQAADRTGDAHAVLGAKIEALNTVISAAAPSQAQAMSSFSANWVTYLGALSRGMSMEEAHTAILDANTEKIRQQAAATAALAAASAKLPQDPMQGIMKGFEIAAQQNPLTTQIANATAKVDQLKEALHLAALTMPELNVTPLTASLAKAEQELQQLQFGPLIDQMREKMAQLAATWDGTQSGLLAAQERVANEILASATRGTKQYDEIKAESARLEVQRRTQAGEEILAQAREEVAALNATEGQGAAERLAAEQQVWSALLQGDRLTASQRVQVARQTLEAVAATERATAAETTAIARETADTDIELAKLTLDQKRTALEIDVSANRVSARQKLQIMTDLTTQLADLNEIQLTNELASLQPGTAAWQKAFDQIRVLRAKLNNDLETLDKQYQADVAKSTKMEATEWKSAVGEIESAETTLIGDLLSKRKSLSASLLQISGQLITKEIENDAKAVTTSLLLSKGKFDSEKSLEQGGYLYHKAVELLKTNDTTLSQTAQTTANATGNAARVAAQTAAAAQGQAAQGAANEAQVQGDAARAAAGAYAAVVGEPLIGPAEAPAAAAQAYTAVEGFASQAALATGAWNIPQTMVATVHSGETVLPRPFADEFRANVRSGGSQGGGGTPTGDTHFHGDVNVADTDIGKMLSSKQGQRALVKSLGSAFRQGVRA